VSSTTRLGSFPFGTNPFARVIRHLTAGGNRFHGLERKLDVQHFESHSFSLVCRSGIPLSLRLSNSFLLFLAPRPHILIMRADTGKALCAQRTARKSTSYRRSQFQRAPCRRRRLGEQVPGCSQGGRQYSPLDPWAADGRILHHVLTVRRVLLAKGPTVGTIDGQGRRHGHHVRAKRRSADTRLCPKPASFETSARVSRLGLPMLQGKRRPWSSRVCDVDLTGGGSTPDVDPRPDLFWTTARGSGLSLSWRNVLPGLGQAMTPQ